MKRQTSWMDKPVTWGGFFKLTGICTVIGTVISAVSWVVLLEPAWWRTMKDFVKRLLRK